MGSTKVGIQTEMVIPRNGANQTHSYGPHVPYKSIHPCLTLINQTHVFMAGGAKHIEKDKDSNISNYLSDAWLFDLRSETWHELENMGSAGVIYACWMYSGLSVSTSIFIFGYFEDQASYSQRFDLSTRVWTGDRAVRYQK